MDAETKRIARLRLWLAEFDGKIANFCRAYNLPRTRASYLSQILSGNRPLGERAARKLEDECRRPSGWLDMGASEPQQLRYDVARVAQLPTADRELIEGFIEFVLQRSERRTVQSTSASINLVDEFVPPKQQIEAIRKADSRSRNKVDNGKRTPRKRNAA